MKEVIRILGLSMILFSFLHAQSGAIPLIGEPFTGPAPNIH